MIFVKALIVISSDCTFTLYAVKWMKAFNTMKYFDVFWIHNLAGTFLLYLAESHDMLSSLKLISKRILKIWIGVSLESCDSLIKKNSLLFIFYYNYLIANFCLFLFLMLITVLICGPFR